jgi:hypothetical protein
VKISGPKVASLADLKKDRRGEDIEGKDREGDRGRVSKAVFIRFRERLWEIIKY